jgi:enoyl-CoA hydratase
MTPPAPQADMTSVVVTRDGPVTIVTLNRPERKNAVDGVTAQLLFEAFQAFDTDDTAAVAVFAGAGGAFCAGADLKAVATGDLERRRDIAGRNTIAPNTIAPMGPSRLELSKPVIAAIEGYAVAGGMELALWADLRVMADDATFGIFCRRFGVPLIDGGTIRLPRLIGQSRAMDLILTGRPVGAAEALAMGLANRVVPKGTALAASITLAHQLAAFPQACLRNDRRSVLKQWDLDHEAAPHLVYQGGLAVISSGETLDGATQFASGKGRQGRFE